MPFEFDITVLLISRFLKVFLSIFSPEHEVPQVTAACVPLMDRLFALMAKDGKGPDLDGLLAGVELLFTENVDSQLKRTHSVCWTR